MGSKIYLRPASVKDAKGDWYKWLNDREVSRFLIDRFWPNTKEKQLDFVKNSLRSNNDRLIFSICLKKNDKHIGQCSLSSINWVHRYADIAILIGEKRFRKSLISLEAYRLLLEIAFDRFNLNNIKSAMVNPGVEKIHQLLGFKLVGTYKDFLLIDNKKCSIKLYSMNKLTWNKKK